MKIALTELEIRPLLGADCSGLLGELGDTPLDTLADLAADDLEAEVREEAFGALSWRRTNGSREARARLERRRTARPDRRNSPQDARGLRVTVTQVAFAFFLLAVAPGFGLCGATRGGGVA